MDYVEIELKLPKPPSLNKIYAGKHWAIRKKYKDDYKKECIKELEKHDPFTCETFRLDIRYNSRLDIDNGILVSKFLADTLVSLGVVKDDSPKYYDKVSITYEKTIEKDSYLVTIRCTEFKILENENLPEL
jgi:Holliday junction resolvase RusA-like endonuclease